MLTAAMTGFQRDGEKFQLPTFNLFPDHATAISYSINAVGFSMYNRTSACCVPCFWKSDSFPSLLSLIKVYKPERKAREKKPCFDSLFATITVWAVLSLANQ